MIDASLDDWDRYETLQWRTGEAWLREHPDDPDAAEIRRELDASRDRYLRWQRDTLGWAIVAGRGGWRHRVVTHARSRAGGR